MLYSDPQVVRVNDLLNELISVARETDQNCDRIQARARLEGFMQYHLVSLYRDLAENDDMVNYFPGRIIELIDKIKNETVMDALKNG